MRGPPPDYERRGWGGPRGRMGPPSMNDGRGPPYGGPPGPMGPPFRGFGPPPMGMGKATTTTAAAAAETGQLPDHRILH
jgi:hypothetical protein